MPIQEFSWVPNKLFVFIAAESELERKLKRVFAISVFITSPCNDVRNEIAFPVQMKLIRNHSFSTYVCVSGGKKC